MQDTYVEESTLQLVVDQLEELVVTIIEEIRERPGVAAALFAAVAGAVIGGMLATGAVRRRSSPRARVTRRARGVGDTAELLGLGVRLLQNPIVRAFVMAAIERQLKRRLSS